MRRQSLQRLQSGLERLLGTDGQVHVTRHADDRSRHRYGECCKGQACRGGLRAGIGSQLASELGHLPQCSTPQRPGMMDVLDLLQMTLSEEKKTDEKLTFLAEQNINLKAEKGGK